MTTDTLVRGLNDDLAAEWGTIIRYTYQAGRAFGLLGAELREMFTREIADELGHAAFLTDVITDLGGDPATTPKGFDKPDDLKGMLDLDLQMELGDVEHYTERAPPVGRTPCVGSRCWSVS